jgi:hypothetical protein
MKNILKYGAFIVMIVLLFFLYNRSPSDGRLINDGTLVLTVVNGEAKLTFTEEGIKWARENQSYGRFHKRMESYAKKLKNKGIHTIIFDGACATLALRHLANTETVTKIVITGDDKDVSTTGLEDYANLSELTVDSKTSDVYSTLFLNKTVPQLKILTLNEHGNTSLTRYPNLETLNMGRITLRHENQFNELFDRHKELKEVSFTVQGRDYGSFVNEILNRETIVNVNGMSKSSWNPSDEKNFTIPNGLGTRAQYIESKINEGLRALELGHCLEADSIPLNGKLLFALQIGNLPMELLTDGDLGEAGLSIENFHNKYNSVQSWLNPASVPEGKTYISDERISESLEECDTLVLLRGTHTVSGKYIGQVIERQAYDVEYNIELIDLHTMKKQTVFLMSSVAPYTITTYVQNPAHPSVTYIKKYANYGKYDLERFLAVIAELAGTVE